MWLYFLIGLFIGAMIGACLGVLVAGMMVAAARTHDGIGGG